jgi:opacity protein-like surface antigen
VKTKLYTIIALLLVALSTQAQDQPEYRMELGAGAGLAAYVGDLNSNPAKGMRPMGALVAKYRSNPRMAWALNLGLSQLKGSTKDSDSWLPELSETIADFKTSIVDVQLRFEYNFWAFGTGREYHGAQPLTPFITLGLGATIGNAKITQTGADELKKNSFAAQMPIGLGVKYKVADRLNLTAEWIMHFTGTDKLDGMEDPYGIRSKGLFKNTDGYSTLQLSLTYDLWAKCRVCHNDRD